MLLSLLLLLAAEAVVASHPTASESGWYWALPFWRLFRDTGGKDGDRFTTLGIVFLVAMPFVLCTCLVVLAYFMTAQEAEADEDAECEAAAEAARKPAALQKKINFEPTRRKLALSETIPRPLSAASAAPASMPNVIVTRSAAAAAPTNTSIRAALPATISPQLSNEQALARACQWAIDARSKNAKK